MPNARPSATPAADWSCQPQRLPLDHHDPDQGKGELQDFFRRIGCLHGCRRVPAQDDEVEPRGEARKEGRRPKCRGVGPA